MSANKINPMLLIDFYKAVHAEMLPKGITKSVSYFTPRMSRVNRWDKVVMFGLQGFIKNYLIDYLFQSFEDVGTIFLVLSLSLIPAIYFALTQGAKRNHDIGNSGWFILLPLNNFIILFIPSEKADNKYGEYLD